VNENTLSMERLFEPTLPVEWEGVLGSLAELSELQDKAKGSLEERRERARALHARLIKEAPMLAEPLPSGTAWEGSNFRLWFTESVLLWIQLAKTSSAPLIDTLGSRSLLDFPLDLPDEKEGASNDGAIDGANRSEPQRRSGAECIRAGLREALGWAEEDLATVERAVDHLTSNLPLKRRMTRALATLLAEGDRLSAHGRADLMRSFYGPVPWRPGDVDLVMTSTAIFFCIPAEPGGTRLDVPAFDARPEEERRAIARFLEALGAANVAETTRFPAFGFFDPGFLDPAMVGAIAEVVCCPRAVVEQTLATMVSILPSSDVERYLVHDAWGHTWQEALMELEWEYAVLPRLDEPLWMGGILGAGDTGSATEGGGARPGIASAFVDRGGFTELDEAALQRFAEADLRAKIQVATSAALSEMLADFMESKYARKRPGFPLPTSSLLPITSLKLDLTLSDVHRQVSRWTAPYRSLAEDEETRARLVEVLARSLPAPGLLEAVDRAGRFLVRSFAPAFDEALRPEPAKERDSPDRSLRSSVFRRLVLQFTLIAAEMERALEASSPSERPVRPLSPAWLDPASCPDLFAITLARIYEQDHQGSFWHLDQIMAQCFSVAGQQMAAALRRRAD
jgi:hypothetical protein